MGDKRDNVYRSPIIEIFEWKQRLDVPLFQRKYVWEEENWIPFWEDIKRKFNDEIKGDEDAPKHFFGAMVFYHESGRTVGVRVGEIIDGQQRLVTFQIFLSALRGLCREFECVDIAEEIEKSLYNAVKGTGNDYRYKVWPTEKDREPFKNVVESAGYNELSRLYPEKKKKYARKLEPRPKVVEAYFFFYKKLKKFFEDPSNTQRSGDERSWHKLLMSCRNALDKLQVVVIDLEKSDDPQVIFESLNALGEPLLSADLIRNYIFLRAKRESLDIDTLHDKYQSGLDGEFWDMKIKQGRMKRPRSDIFIQHFLAGCRMRDVSIRHLYDEYKHWSKESSMLVEEELDMLHRNGKNFRRFLEPERGDSFWALSHFIQAFEASTIYPLVIRLFDSDMPANEWQRIGEIIESYVVRRAFCGLPSKNYNKLFISVLGHMMEEGFSADTLLGFLNDLEGDSILWPDDSTFEEGWMRSRVYRSFGNQRLVHIFSRINNRLSCSRSEVVLSDLPTVKHLTVEHLMPQKWVDNWPLLDGRRGLTTQELGEKGEDDKLAEATRRRNRALNRIGNLTILTERLNKDVSNSAWEIKRPKLKEYSVLKITHDLDRYETWDEEAIDERAEALFEHAREIWSK